MFGIYSSLSKILIKIDFLLGFTSEAFIGRKVIKTLHYSELTLPPPPPPDVTVVPLPTNISHQCTANAVMLPDIAAQAPNVMNTTNR